MKRTAKSKNSRLKQLYNGDWVIVSGVSPALVDQVQAAVKDPEVPIVITEEGDSLENPTDPAYLRELERVADVRQRRALHAIVLFGLELVDEEGTPIDPPDNGVWERKLTRVGVDWEEEMLSLMGREEFMDDDDKEQARKEAYVLLVAWSGHKSDVDMVMSLAGANQLAQQQAESTFQR